MRDKDSQLIFENYLDYRKNIILEADGEKWEDKSSAWFWLKVLDPTGFSSYPDVWESIKEVVRRPKDVGPWAILILNIFLALPNLGLLAFGVGGIGWASLRGLAKAAIKAGDEEAIRIAEKVLKTAKDSAFLERTMLQFGETLSKKGLVNQSTVDLYMTMVKTGSLSETFYKFSKGMKGEVVKDVARLGREGYGVAKNEAEKANMSLPSIKNTASPSIENRSEEVPKTGKIQEDDLVPQL